MDHLGMGNFGSRDRENAGKVLHPGADDNASGTAGVIILADRMVEEYRNLPEGAEARTILFIAFDAEESGLNGAFHYVRNPIGAIGDHVLMMNYDMIGRITNKRLSVSGGAMAGLDGMCEVAGPMGQITEHVSNNYGFAAIIVAFVARLNPVGIFFASLLMALLYLGGEQAQQYLNLPSSISNVFQGMLLMFLLGSDVFINYRLRWKEAAG